jgi:hypothetical protein
MSKPFVYALALIALTLSPAIATAKNNSGGGVSRSGSAPVTRQQFTDNKPQIGFKKMKVLHCGQSPRGDGHGGVVMVTVCTKG